MVTGEGGFLVVNVFECVSDVDIRLFVPGIFEDIKGVV